MGFFRELQQEDLPKLSYDYHEFAQIVGDKAMSPYLAVVTIEPKPDNNRLVWQASKTKNRALKGIQLLNVLKDIEELRGSIHEVTRHNIALYSRLDAQAIRLIHEDAHSMGREFSRTALDGLQQVLGQMHNLMSMAYLPITRPVIPDREALNHFNSA